MKKGSYVLVLSLLILATLNPYYISVCKMHQDVQYRIDDMNEIWDQYDSHYYSTSTYANAFSVEIADKLINNNEIYLLRYWDPFVYDENKLDWSEDPFDDWTWAFYYHSLRMVSYLLSAYEVNGNITYLERAQWLIESWIEHNPCPREQASDRAWDDHSTANRITIFIHFWDHYSDSEIFDFEFANEFLNSLRIHGEYTANSQYYTWGHNHGIYQDRALIQLAVLFPNFKDSAAWLDTGIYRLSLHLEEGVTASGVHKEHSPSYHLLVLRLFMSISSFTNHYNVTTDELDDIIYKMQEYLVHIAKPNHRVPLVGDSVASNILSIPDEQILNEHLLYLKSEGNDGVKIPEESIVYTDAGVAIFKNDWDTSTPFYLALFNGFHSSVHKQSDDLSFVLTYQETDYFVDSGKYNFVESDPYRIYIRSVFAHNSISVDGQTYSFRSSYNIDNPMIEVYVISTNYSYVRASHTLFEDVKITRTVIFFDEGAIFLHDKIESNSQHEYTQIFNIGQDVSINVSDTSNVLLSSTVDDSSLTLQHLTDFSNFESYNGSNDPVMGWQSTTFNEVTPITSLHFIMEGKSVEFETAINIELEIVNVEISQSENGDVYSIEFSDGSIKTIELD